MLAQATSDLTILKGRWVRPDGGYVIDIKNFNPSGKLEATYSNPNPIAVSKAEATAEAGVLKMFFELRGAGYPGSTYTLSYVPSTDQLRGIYFQAAARQSPPDMGWNAMREQIFANQKRLGVLRQIRR